MKQILNTLYVMTQGAYIRLDHETLKIDVERETRLQVPLHHLGAVVCFGDVLVSPRAMHRCAADGRAIVLLDRNGRFMARVVGPVSGNVLLRRAQHLAYSDRNTPVLLARNIVAAKIRNSRQIVLRGARESTNESEEQELRDCARALADCLRRIKGACDLDTIRGIEGEAGRQYFSVFSLMVKADRTVFGFAVRSRRPPKDPINALISFLYALLLNDCVAAVESVGLDPQVGFLHTVRPGRPSLALDLLEETRSVIADRLALTLVNRGQLTKKHFEFRPGGAVLLSDDGRKVVVAQYQRKKREEILHRVLDRKVPLALVSHVQGRLLARYLRGDIEDYIPFIYP